MFEGHKRLLLFFSLTFPQNHLLGPAASQRETNPKIWRAAVTRLDLKSPTSASRILLKALVMAASTAIMSNSI